MYEIAKEAIDAIHKTGKPSFMHVSYYRYLEHVGVNEDFNAGYRSRDDFEKWLARDPIALQRLKLLRFGMSEVMISAYEKKAQKEIAVSIDRARNDPFPKAQEIYDDMYV